MMRISTLRRALRRLNFTPAAMDASTESVCIVDVAGRLAMLNPSAERLFGWSEAEVLSQELHTTLHRCGHDDPDECALFRASVAHSPFLRGEEVLRRRDGAPIPVAYLSTPLVLNGTIAGTVFVFQDLTDREREVQALRESEQRYRCLAEASPEPMWLTDQYGYITMANRRAAELIGVAHWSQMLQLNSLELFTLEDRPGVTQQRRQATDTDSPVTEVHEVVRRHPAGDREAVRVELRITPVLDADGSVMGHLFAAAEPARNLTVVAQPAPATIPLEQAVALTLAGAGLPVDTIPRVLQTICENGGWEVGAYWHLDQDQQALRCHTTWYAPGGTFDALEGINRQLSLTPGVDLPGRIWTRNDPVWLPDIVADNDVLRSLAASKDGLHAAFGFPISVGGAIQGVMEFLARDVRPPQPEVLRASESTSAQIGWFLERHHAEKALRHQALHDSLTGLPNRTLLVDRLRRALFVARETTKPVSLFLIDLDRFKQVNDTHGHDLGDALLMQVARRLNGVLRDSDTVARLGGDEFAVLLPGTPEVGALVVARKIVDELAQPFEVEGFSLSIGGSIGIAVYPDHGQDASQLLQAADAAMYVAKRQNRGYAVYSLEADLALLAPPRARDIR